MKKLIAFDLDGPLAPGKSSVDGEISALQAGVQCIAVKVQDDTKRVIEIILACLGHQKRTLCDSNEDEHGSEFQAACPA